MKKSWWNEELDFLFNRVHETFRIFKENGSTEEFEKEVKVAKKNFKEAKDKSIKDKERKLALKANF